MYVFFVFVYGDNTVVCRCFWGYFFLYIYNTYMYIYIFTQHALAVFGEKWFFISIQRSSGKNQVGNFLQMASKRCPGESAQLEGSRLSDPWVDEDLWWTFVMFFCPDTCRCTNLFLEKKGNLLNGWCFYPFLGGEEWKAPWDVNR